MNNYLISYDISDNRLRLKASKLLERKGCVRLQKSVFLAPNYHLKELQTLRHELAFALRLQAGSEDSLLCVAIGKIDPKDMIWQGDNPVLQEALKVIKALIV